ncbi:MAG: hypothetical protein NUW01_05625 [Gemmatimonadaceae bacterium]|nr:hypothetical protein [Gemmatimonadaceae bacterium]
MNGWIAVALWAAGFVVLGALAVFALAYVGDTPVRPWPGVR